jgi:hypothetical protein
MPAFRLKMHACMFFYNTAVFGLAPSFQEELDDLAELCDT